MIVECIADEVNADYGEDYVEATAGEGINVRITIPKMLPESMFPLQFSLESDALSITPNTAKYPKDNLPVANGNSICDGKTSSKSFHYVRTLGYTEYLTLDETLDGMQFTCHFKTNKANSASTIYVDNQYFNKGNDSFYNYTMYNFRNLSFTNNSANANSDVDFTFYLDDNDTSRPRTVEVKLDGLLPQEDSGLTPVGDDNDIYSYTLNIGVKYAKLTLRTISEAAGYDKTYAVTLNAYDGAKAIYHEASHGNVAQRITIDPTSLTMHPGDKKTLTATVWPASTGTGSLSWTTSNSSVVTVDGNGKVTAVGAGTANITVSYDGSVSATCAVTVSGISLNKTATTLMIVNGVQATEQLSVATLPTAVNYTWTSSDNSVATVSNTGLVTAVSSGTATITVTADDGRSANCIVTVKRRYTNVTATFNPSAFATNTTATVDDRVSVNLESNFSYYSNTQLRGAREGYYNYMSFNQYSGAELEDFEITRIVFNCSGDNYVPETNYTTFYTDDSESSTVGSYTVIGSVGTWTGTASTPYMKTYNYWNGIRITSIVVTYSYTE